MLKFIFKKKLAIMVFTLTVVFTLVSGIIIVFGQRLPMPTEDNIDFEVLRKSMTLSDEISYFRGVSSSRIPRNPGHRIVAVRRVNYIGGGAFNDDGRPTQFRTPMVEIELFGEIYPPVTNSPHIIRVGNRNFTPISRGCGLRRGCTMIAMEPQQFDSLMDGAIVSYSIGAGPDAEGLRKSYENGEPEIIYGVKYGRLDKSMIDRFPTVDRDILEP